MLSSALVKANEKIAFHVSFSEPQTHYFEVKMLISNNKEEEINLKMPVWSPGSYLIREYPKNVEGFRAVSKGKTLNSYKTDKNTWKIEANKEKEIEVSYRVYAFEVSVRTSHVDQSHAFLSPTGTFMFIDGKLNLPAEVTIQPHSDWGKISTGLDPVPGKKNTFKASNFDILFDAPFEVGNQEQFYFTAAGVAHEVAMVGVADYDAERLKVDMAKIIESETAIFQENPNKRYVFIVHNYASGGGGLEHLNSTVLGATRDAYKTPSGYTSFLSLVAHEYFHVWNIKRLRPENLGPFDYSNENYTTNLWISEGFTAYYDNLVLKLAGIIDEKSYLSILANDINRVENRPGNHIQSLKESSFDAWIKQYRPNENSINSTVTYYDKGALIGMLLDLKIRHSTQAKQGLGDVMRAMYNQYYKIEDRGFTQKEFEETCERIAGVSLKEIFTYVEEACTPDYNKYLQYAGLELIDINESISIPDLGIRTSSANGKTIVTTVLRDQSGWKDGINVQDEIVSINGYRINSNQDIEKVVSNLKIGDPCTVQLVRDGIMMNLPVTIGISSQKQYVILPVAEENAEQLKIREAWLNQ